MYIVDLKGIFNETFISEQALLFLISLTCIYSAREITYKTMAKI
jgi:hypothetical protein